LTRVWLELGAVLVCVSALVAAALVDSPWKQLALGAVAAAAFAADERDRGYYQKRCAALKQEAARLREELALVKKLLREAWQREAERRGGRWVDLGDGDGDPS
jgi:hypothetical protein